MKRSLRAVAAASGLGLMGALLVGVSPAHADTDASVAARPCGTSIESTVGSGQRAVYRHCTSGSGSVTVRAIINNWPDGGCTTVGPNQELEIWRWAWPGSYARTDRC
jgi:hypothetical protein